jgi:hypothetical protein
MIGTGGIVTAPRAAKMRAGVSALGHFTHRMAVNFNRRLARPILGHTTGPADYAAIGRAHSHPAVTAAGLTAPAGDAAQAAALLDRHGVVVLKGAVDAALAARARQEADRFFARLEAARTRGGSVGITDNVLWQVEGACFPSYRALAEHDRPVANIKQHGGTNGGVTDIFCIDQAARESGWAALIACCAHLGAGPVAALVAAVSPRRPTQFHLLRSESATLTRGLHVDNLNNFYKAFLYLSDVRGIEDGAYAYVPGTHRRSDLIRREARLNSLSGRAEADSFAFEGREVPITGGPGTVIVSCQNGVHRGMPQRAGASRSVLVCNYHR